ncbi:MAG TPA: DUF2809 domain-containing protein [Cyanobacteria bacterium UBA8803]|nr:DUF2809 domain-containing protein [Cyanobacteria bacterium UBA9273]HBL57697.1 DUF2809 domain-containing protein [Cyanobacteria bacterium UBA8803]
MAQNSRARKLLRFNSHSFILFLIIFVIEVIIAIFFRDRWIRPLLGDVLVVMAIAYFIHAFFGIRLQKIAISTLIFAYFIELLQFLKIIDFLGWRDSQLAHLTIGSTFDWRDLVAYTIGVAIIIMTSLGGENK